MNVSFGVRKGAWSSEEDALLKKYVEQYGEGRWHQVPITTGLNRCRKSCRLRWLNYLKPSIKRGDFSVDEVDLIFRLHKLLGNRWSLIAGRLPGRTANDVKNYWNTYSVKKRSTNKHDLKIINRPIKITKANIFRPQPQKFSKKIFWSTEETLVVTLKDNDAIEVNKNNNNCRPNFTPPSTAVTPHVVEEINASTWWESLLSLADEKEKNARSIIDDSEAGRSCNDINMDDVLEGGNRWSIDDKSCNNGCYISSNYSDYFLFDMRLWDVDIENNNKIIM